MFVRQIFSFIVVCSVAFVGLPMLGAEADDDEDEASEEEVEEVLVTGSFIRRDNFDLPSPKNVIDNEDIALSGNAEIGDVIFDQSFQLGVNANAAPFEGICCGLESSDGLGTTGGWGDNADNQQGNQGTEVWANLRGLGTRATMTMMDGHRLPADTTQRGERAGVDVSGMYPSIAIGRVETILDGASALYGAEAVSGVINMVPRKDFEGFEVSLDYSAPFDDGAPNTGISMLAGVQGDRGRAIFALEMRDTDRMRFTDRPDFLIDTKNPWQRHSSADNPSNRFYPQTQWSKFWKDSYNVGGNPASRFGAPVRDVNGDLAAMGEYAFGRESNGQAWGDNVGMLARTNVKDPTCGHAFGSGYSDNGPEPTNGGPFWGFYGDDVGATGFRARWQEQFGPAHGLGFENTYGETYIYNDIGKHGNFLNGYIDPNDPGFHCRMTDSDIQDLQAESERKKGFAYFEYEVNDYITLRGELVASSVDYNTRLYAPSFNDFTNDAGTADDRMGIAVGSNPGNPFRAFADGSSHLGWDAALNNVNEYPGTDTTSVRWGATVARQLDFDDQNGDGIYQYLSEPGEYLVFAQDANGDGIPDRMGNDGLHDAYLNRNPAYRVLLMGMDDADGDGIADRFDPDSGGIRLYEDVRFGDGELFAFPKNPRNVNLDWVHKDGVASYLRRTQRSDVRLRLGGEIRIPDSEWIIDADWVYSKGLRETNQPQEITPALIQAMRCQAGPSNDSCWNPFGTTYMMIDENGFVIGNPDTKFPTDNDPGVTPAGHEFVNTEEENRHAGLVMQYDLQDLQMNLVDLVASNSSLFELPYNDAPVGLAVGLHWRTEDEEYRPHGVNQSAIGGSKIGLRQSEQESKAIFAEVNLPLMQNDTWGDLEAQLALRYTEITGEGIIGQPGSAKFTTTIPKIAVRYSPNEWLAIRGSMTEGFVTPGLYSLFGEESITNVGNVRDYICDVLPDLQDCITTGATPSGSTPGVRTANAGNADLRPETSELYNVGMSLKLLDGNLVLDVDYTNVEFQGSIENVNVDTHVAFNEPGFLEYVQAQCPGTLVDWDNNQRQGDETLNALTPQAFRDDATGDQLYTSPADLACRQLAASSWVSSAANAGLGERSFGSAALQRGRDGAPLSLAYVEAPWAAQGAQNAETIIYGVRYGFELPDNGIINWATDWMGEDKGQFMLTGSMTQFLSQSLQKFRSFGCDASMRNSGGFCNNDSVFAGIEVDGVGNRNSQYFSPPGMELYSRLPPTPEFRVNASLRWFKGPHVAQLAVRWHDSVTNINVAWNEMVERERADPRAVMPSWTYSGIGDEEHGYPHFTEYQGGLDQDESSRCAYQPWPVCKLDAEAYFDVSYSYTATDILGLSSIRLNASIRNVFDNYPKPITQFSGHEPYLDNIMGRMYLLRINFGL